MRPWHWWRMRPRRLDLLRADQAARLKWVGLVLRGTPRYDPIGYVDADEWLDYIMLGVLRNTGLFRFIIP